MKLLFVLASLFLAMTAQAEDRKVGTVIAVEREISDLKNTCLKATQDDRSKPASFFSCAIKYVGDGEMAISKGRVLKLMDERCQVVGESVNGVIFITFASAKNRSTFEESQACLERALVNKDYLKVVLYTLE